MVQVGPTQVGLEQINTAQVGTAQVRLAQVAPSQVGTLQECTSQIRASKKPDRILLLACEAYEARFLQEPYYVAVPVRIQPLYHRRRPRPGQRAHLAVRI